MFRANQVQSPLPTIPTVSQSKLPISNYKYSLKGSVNSSIPLPRHSPKSTLVHSSSRKSSAQQDLDTVAYSKKNNMSVLSRASSNSNRRYEHGKKGDYSSDDSSNLSGELQEYIVYKLAQGAIDLYFFTQYFINIREK